MAGIEVATGQLMRSSRTGSFAYRLFDQSNLPQCEANRQNVYFNDVKGKIYKCAHKARYVIDGQNLCQKHASITALKILLSIR